MRNTNFPNLVESLKQQSPEDVWCGTDGLMGQAARKIERLQTMLREAAADVRRWAYVRDCLAQSHSLRMDGTKGWRLRPIYRHRAATVSGAVDLAIAEMMEQHDESGLDTPG